MEKADFPLDERVINFSYNFYIFDYLQTIQLINNQNLKFVNRFPIRLHKFVRIIRHYSTKLAVLMIFKM